MAVSLVSLKQPWNPLGGVSEVNTTNELPDYKDETLSVSGDSSVYSEEGNVAKAARLEEPLRRDWSSPLDATSLLPIQTPSTPRSWKPSDSAALYNVPGWSEGYFEVTENGHLAVKPRGDSGPAFDLNELTSQLSAKGLPTPIILRFPDILGDRIAKLNNAFASAIRRSGYPNTYRGVFPVKCNHDRDVVRSMVEFGRPYGFGLEVGSKAELVMAAAALAGDCNEALLVCNGYKDAEYMELAMRIGQLGPCVIIVMEQPEEVALAINAATAVPTSKTLLGIRAKLGTVHGGHWASTSGDAAKFGLTSRQVVAAISRLSAASLLPRLALLHFHVGSQMSSLGEVRDALAEGAALYAEIAKMGAVGLRYLDVGGGLAIDYDGSHSEEHTSRAYCLEDYAQAVVTAVGEACTSRGVAPPTLVSESGRALASHHAVVIFDVMQKEHSSNNAPVTDDSNAYNSDDSTTICSTTTFSPVSASLRGPLERCTLMENANANIPSSSSSTNPKAAFIMSTLHQILDSMGPTQLSLRGALRDAAYYKDDTLRAFKLGMVGLADKAAIEEIVDMIDARSRELASIHNVALHSGSTTTDMPVRMLHINLSVFRSAVDSWAIGQVFPVVPLTGMDQRPDMHAVLADLTCDSDGKIDRFINPQGGEPHTALPLLSTATPADQPYRLGMFLTGVYQETMGSNHNMFGSLNSATIRIRPDDDIFVVERMVPGENVATVLSRAGHDAREMMQSMSSMAATAVAEQSTNPADAQAAVDYISLRMDGYTYMRQ